MQTLPQDRKTYFAWLNNAYGQEQAMVRMYRMHARDASNGLNDFPELRQRLETHARTAQRHGEMMAECLRRHHLTPHPAKIALGEIMGGFLGFTGDVTIDKVIMNNLTDLGMAYFEIGAYRTLIAGAEAMNDLETVTTCQEILKQEQAFADWIEAHIAETAQTFLRRTVSPPPA